MYQYVSISFIHSFISYHHSVSTHWTLFTCISLYLFHSFIYLISSQCIYSLAHVSVCIYFIHSFISYHHSVSTHWTLLTCISMYLFHSFIHLISSQCIYSLDSTHMSQYRTLYNSITSCSLGTKNSPAFISSSSSYWCGRSHTFYSFPSSMAVYIYTNVSSSFLFILTSSCTIYYW